MTWRYFDLDEKCLTVALQGLTLVLAPPYLQHQEYLFVVVAAAAAVAVVVDYDVVAVDVVPAAAFAVAGHAESR